MSARLVDRAFVLGLLNDLVATNSVNPSVGAGPGEAALSNLLFERLSAIGRLEVRRQHVTADMKGGIAAMVAAAKSLVDSRKVTYCKPRSSTAESPRNSVRKRFSDQLLNQGNRASTFWC